MLRKLSVALATGAVATVGFFSLASSAGAATIAQPLAGNEHHKNEFSLEVDCKPDAEHVNLIVGNESDKDAKFVVKKKDHGFAVTGIVEAEDEVTVTVPFESEDDTWLLFVKPKHDGGWDKEDAQVNPADLQATGGEDYGRHNHGFKFVDKVRVDNPEDCEVSPTTTPTATAAPTTTKTAQPLPVTGSSMVGLMGVGFVLFGVGGAMLLLGRRRRALR